MTDDEFLAKHITKSAPCVPNAFDLQLSFTCETYFFLSIYPPRSQPDGDQHRAHGCP